MRIIESLIRKKETDGFKFKPNRQFYKTIGIRQKRFWQIVREEVDPTVKEFKKIADYFNVDFKTLIDSE